MCLRLSHISLLDYYLVKMNKNYYVDVTIMVLLRVLKVNQLTNKNKNKERSIIINKQTDKTKQLLLWKKRADNKR